MRKGWDYKKLGDCFSYIKNGANIKQKKDADGFPITRIETLSGGVFNRDRMGYAGIHDLSKYASYVLESKDLLMSHINSKTYIGRTVEYKSNNNETIIHGMNLLRLKAIHELIDSTFFAYYAQSEDFKSKIARIRKDAVNQSSFAISDLKRFDIPLPPLSTQLSIVSELDKINELIRLKKEQLKDFDNLAQSIFYEMFGDPVENERGWEVKKLGEVCSQITDGTHNSPTNTEKGDFMYVTAKNIKRDGIILDNITYVDANTHQSIYSRCNPEYGDVLYIKDGVTTGIATINNLREEFSLLSSVALLKLGDKIVNYYLKAVLNTQSLYNNIRSNMGGAAITRLTLVKIKAIKIPLPPLPLQHLFAQRIEQIEHQKAEVQKSITDLETLLASRMQYWFE